MKNLLTFFLALLFTISGSAQVDVGIQAGINLSSLEQNLVEESVSDLVTNYYLGLSPRVSIGSFALIGDLNYSVKGSMINVQNEPDLKYKYSYIEVIPQVEIRLFSILGVSVGPSFSIKINEQLRIQDQSWSKTKDSIKNGDMGAYIAGRVYIDKLYAMVAYNHGLTDINSLTWTDIDGIIRGNVSSKNRNFQIGVGYLF